MCLTEKSFNRLKEKFEHQQHHPDKEQMQALYRIQNVMTQMVYGQAERVFYASSVDPGIGKSSAIIAWMKSFLEYPELIDVGVLICVDRYGEMERFIHDIGLCAERYACFVADGHELSSQGVGKLCSNEAQVLFTTKEQIMRHGKRFSDETSPFWYKGEPRPVTVWDESLIAGKPLSIPHSALGKLLDPLVDHPTQHDLVLKMINDVYQKKDRTIYEVPSLGLSYSDWLLSFSNEPTSTSDLAISLWQMSGQPVTIRSSKNARVLVNCSEWLPDWLKPCLVTDASARVRGTYRLQDLYRQDIKWLKTATKSYDNLTCHVIPLAGGKGSYKTESYQELVQAVAQVINNNPAEQFLVVYHLPHYKRDPDLAKDLLKHIDDNKDRVKFLHWGIHTATNDYVEMPNIILAGTLFYSNADYEALGRAASGRVTANGVFQPHEEKDIRQGEIAHHLLQAAGRGALRKCEDGHCPSVNLWVVAAPNTGLKGILQSTFPNCKVVDWNPHPLAFLNSTCLKSLEFLKYQKDIGKCCIPARTVREHIGKKDWHTFNRDVYSHEGFQSALKELGWAVEGEGRNRRFVLNHNNQQEGNVSKAG